jgi:hypothetical protein
MVKCVYAFRVGEYKIEHAVKTEEEKVEGRVAKKRPLYKKKTRGWEIGGGRGYTYKQPFLAFFRVA